MFSLLKIKLANMVRTKRGIAIKLRDDTRESVRLYRKLGEFLPKAGPVIKAAIVEDVEVFFKEWMKAYNKGIKHVLHGEKEIIAEEETTFNATTNEEYLLKSLDYSLNKSKLDEKTKQQMKTKLRLLYKSFKDIHVFELSKLRDEFQSVHSELKNEEHLRDFNFNVDETMKFNKIAWHLKGEIHDIENLTNTLKDLENKDTKLFDKMIANDNNLLKELEKDEEELINQGEKLIKMISDIIKEYTFMMRVFVHYFFLYYKYLLLIKKFHTKLRENDFPDENLIIIATSIAKEDKDINEHTSLIFNAIRRLARLQE